MGRLRQLFFRSRNPEPANVSSKPEALSDAQSEQDTTSKSVTPSRPNALSDSVLNRVPLDILVYIMDYLPSVSAVAFSVSCMHLKCSLGTGHFAKVSSSGEDTFALLALLAIDLPDHIVCFFAKGYTASKTLIDITAQHTAPLGGCMPLYTFPPV